MATLAPEPMTVSPAAALLRTFEQERDARLRLIECRLPPALMRKEGAEEILQKVRIRLHDTADDFERWVQDAPDESRDVDRMAHFWIHRAVADVLHEAQKYWRRPGRDVGKEVPLPDHSSILVAIGLADPGTDPRDAAAREEVQRRVRDTIARLDPIDQDVLWLRSIEGHPHQAVAEILNIRPDAVRQRHGRAVRRFIEEWAERYGAEGF
jgi:RNA polymerase sigma factor (sigma-70 family)